MGDLSEESDFTIVRSLSGYFGLMFRGPWLREWVPLPVRRNPEVTAYPEWLEDCIRQAQTGEYPVSFIRLGQDWRFPELTRTVALQPEHEFSGPIPILGQLVPALLALERTLHTLRHGLAAEAVADFWVSVDVREYVDALFEKLESASGRGLRAAHQEYVQGRHQVRQLLADYAKFVRSHPLPAAVTSPLQRPEDERRAEPITEQGENRVAAPSDTLANPNGAPVAIERAAADQDDSAKDSGKQRGGRPQGIPVNGEKLRELRQLAGLTQAALAEKCEWSVDTIQRGEAGGRWPDQRFKELAPILSALTDKNISADDLQDRKN